AVGICYFELEQYQQASQCFREGIHIAQARLAALPDETWQEETIFPSPKQKAERNLYALLYELSLSTGKEGNLDEAISLCQKLLSFNILKSEDEGTSLNQLAILYQEKGRIADARELLYISCVNTRRMSDSKALEIALNELGIVHFEIGNYTEGVRSLVESIRLKQKTNNMQGIQVSLKNLQVMLRKYPFSLL